MDKPLLMTGHREDWINFAHHCEDRIEELEAENAKLRELEARLHEVKEVYAGMEGFEPETAPEAYCLRIIEQMYKAALGGDE